MPKGSKELTKSRKEEIINAKKASNSKYFNHSYAIIGNPNTGEIIAASGLSLQDGTFRDITANIITYKQNEANLYRSIALLSSVLSNAKPNIFKNNDSLTPIAPGRGIPDTVVYNTACIENNWKKFSEFSPNDLQIKYGIEWNKHI